MAPNFTLFVHACNCNCKWSTCIAPLTRTPRAHYRANPYPGAHKQNQTKMFSDHDKTSPSIAAVSAPSAACSMLAESRCSNRKSSVAYSCKIYLWSNNEIRRTLLMEWSGKKFFEASTAWICATSSQCVIYVFIYAMRIPCLCRFLKRVFADTWATMWGSMVLAQQR